MENYKREYPLFSACGLNCALCPRYHTSGPSRCPGCGGENFLLKHPSCAVINCMRRHGEIEYCYECDEFPCKKYDGADLSDSFITHLNQVKDLDKAKDTGIDGYKVMLGEKADILRFLLDNYDDGRKKSFFCLAVNLLEPDDVRDVVARLTRDISPENGDKKEKAAKAAGLFQDMARNRGVTLELRKKKRSEPDKKD